MFYPLKPHWPSSYKGTLINDAMQGGGLSLVWLTCECVSKKKLFNVTEVERGV